MPRVSDRNTNTRKPKPYTKASIRKTWKTNLSKSFHVSQRRKRLPITTKLFEDHS